MSGVVVVTGASRGIGAAIAVQAARAGYTVVVNYARDGDGAAGVVARVEAAGGRAAAFAASVARDDDVTALFAFARTLGPLAGLVNNAGITGGGARVADVATQTLVETFAVNVIGAFACARAAIPQLARSQGNAGGAIVNISSLAARLGGGGEWVHYAASKGAIDSFTRGLASELASDGIRVNAVAPGLIETDLHATFRARPARALCAERAAGARRYAGRSRASRRLAAVARGVVRDGCDSGSWRRALKRELQRSGAAQPVTFCRNVMQGQQLAGKFGPRFAGYALRKGDVRRSSARIDVDRDRSHAAIFGA